MSFNDGQARVVPREPCQIWARQPIREPGDEATGQRTLIATPLGPQILLIGGGAKLLLVFRIDAEAAVIFSSWESLRKGVK